MARLEKNIIAYAEGVPSPSTGSTSNDIHIFIDESGNVNQVPEGIKEREKFYPDYLEKELHQYEFTVIGVEETIPMGVVGDGPISYSLTDVMVYAKYN
jgi:hypothetical protein